MRNFNLYKIFTNTSIPVNQLSHYLLFYNSQNLMLKSKCLIHNLLINLNFHELINVHIQERSRRMSDRYELVNVLESDSNIDTILAIDKEKDQRILLKITNSNKDSESVQNSERIRTNNNNITNIDESTIIESLSLQDYLLNRYPIFISDSTKYKPILALLDTLNNGNQPENFGNSQKYLIISSLSIAMEAIEQINYILCPLAIENIFIDDNYTPFIDIRKLFLMASETINEKQEKQEDIANSLKESVLTLGLILLSLVSEKNVFQLNGPINHVQQILNDIQDKIPTSCYSLIQNCCESQNHYAFADISRYLIVNQVFEDVDIKKIESSHEKNIPNNREMLLSRGKSYYQAQLYEVALEYFARATNIGSAEAYTYIGHCYYHGYGVPQNYEIGLENYKKAAELGHTRANINIGFCYMNGKGVSRDSQIAYSFYQKVAELGDSEGQFEAGLCNYNGEGIEKNVEKAYYYAKLSAEQNNPSGQWLLGCCYDNGLGIEKNDDEAFTFYKMAADQGHTRSQYQTGMCYLMGKGTNQDDQKAFHYHKLAADKGNCRSQYHVGMCYKDGKGTEQNTGCAIDYLMQASANGNYEADEPLGQLIKSKKSSGGNKPSLSEFLASMLGSMPN